MFIHLLIFISIPLYIHPTFFLSSPFIIFFIFHPLESVKEVAAQSSVGSVWTVGVRTVKAAVCTVNDDRETI